MVFIGEKIFPMKKVRLTESYLTRIISESIKHMINEQADNNQILSAVVDALAQEGTIPATNGENDVEVALGGDDNIIAHIDFIVNDGRQIIPGMKGDWGRYIPDDPDEVEGDFDVEVVNISIVDYGEGVYNLDNVPDNGMVSDALKSLLDVELTR